MGQQSFHMTSRRPYRCSETTQRAAMLVFQTDPVGVGLFFPLSLKTMEVQIKGGL